MSVVRAFLIVVFGLLVAPSCGSQGDPADGTGESRRVGWPPPALRDLRYVLEGFVPTRLAGCEDEPAPVVDPSLPVLDFDKLARVVEDGREAWSLHRLLGKRVRAKGYARPLYELQDASSFVLQEAPLVSCLDPNPPPANRAFVVRLAEGQTFDYTDAPLWVEGTLRIGRFEASGEGDQALFALDGARYEELPAESMVLPVRVAPPAYEDGVYLKQSDSPGETKGRR